MAETTTVTVTITQTTVETFVVPLDALKSFETPISEENQRTRDALPLDERFDDETVLAAVFSLDAADATTESGATYSVEFNVIDRDIEISTRESK